MRFVDRLVVILIGLAFIGVFTVLALVPEAIITVLESIQTLSLLLRLAFVVAVNIVILVVLYLQLRVRRQPSSGLEVKAPGAFTDVNVESARMLILNAVNAVPNVATADATVEAVDGRADVDLHIQVAGRGVHIPQKQKEINRALRQVINKQLGLRMRGKPRVHISLESEQSPPGVDEKRVESRPTLQVNAPQKEGVAKTDMTSPEAEAEVAKSNDEIAMADSAEADDRQVAANSKPAETNNDWLNDDLSALSDEDGDSEASSGKRD